MQQIAIKIIEYKGYNSYLAIDKNNVKYQIEDNRTLKVGNYYKIIITIENRSLGALGKRTRSRIKSIEELKVINNRLYTLDNNIFKSS